MLRTVAGWWVVGLVLTGLVAGSAVFGPDLAGTALRQAAPAPPPVGTCVDQGDLNWTVVSCAAPHHGEVVAAVGAGVDGDEFAAGRCGLAVSEWIGTEFVADERGAVPENGEWTPPGVWVEPATFDGPEGLRSPGWSWTACVATPVIFYPADGRYPGTLRGINGRTAADRPPALRRCHEQPRTPTSQTACDGPHRGELVAVRLVVQENDPASGIPPGPLDTSEDLTRCLDLVTDYLGAPLEAHAGTLRAEIAQVRYGSGAVVQAGSVRSYQRFRLSCLVEVVGDRLLTDSIAGIGTGPLPLD